MANITLLGVNYADVPAVDLPKTGGGTVRFKIPDLVQKTITLNGTYSAEDEAGAPDGYDEVTVNVQNGATMTEVANTYGTGVIITSGQGAAPSATRHTIYFEFEDETDLTIYAYYDAAFVGNAITATTPATYDNKTVTLAQLDGVTWYSYTPSAETWETVWSGTAAATADDPYPYFWLSDMADVTITNGSVWRITIGGNTYRCTAIDTGGSYGVIVGNTKYIGDADNGVDAPFCWYNVGWGAWVGAADVTAATNYNLVFERLVTS